MRCSENPTAEFWSLSWTKSYPQAHFNYLDNRSSIFWQSSNSLWFGDATACLNCQSLWSQHFKFSPGYSSFSQKSPAVAYQFSSMNITLLTLFLQIQFPAYFAPRDYIITSEDLNFSFLPLGVQVELDSHSQVIESSSDQTNNFVNFAFLHRHVIFLYGVNYNICFFLCSILAKSWINSSHSSWQ